MNKKLPVLFIAAVILSISSCNDETYTQADIKVEQQLKKESIIAETAIKARNYFFETDSRKSITVSGIDYITTYSTRSTDIDTLIYIVNFADNNGFAVLSAVDKDDPVYAVSDKGNYISGGDNPEGVEFYMQNAKALIGFERDTTNKIITPGDPSHLQYVELIKDTLNYVKVKPRVQVHWGQEGIYAKYCEHYAYSYNHGATGCVPTAIGMVMSYFKYPWAIKIDFDENVPEENLRLDWYEMIKHTYTQSNCDGQSLGFCQASNIAHDQMAKLLRQLGHLGNATYNIVYDNKINNYVAITGMDPNKAAYIFQKYNYLFNGYYAYSEGDTNELSDDCILFMAAYSNNSLAHCFIVDGCQNLTVKTTEKYYDTVTEPWTLLNTRESTVTNNFMHINWGGDGYDDGYYRDNVFDVDQMLRADYSDRTKENFHSSYNQVYYATVKLKKNN